TLHVCCAARLRHFCGLLLATISLQLSAAQTDLHGPAGSVSFGSAVLVLANGNFVVTDPDAQSGAGAVYLYNPNGGVISTLTGSNTNDHVGDGGVVSVGNGNLVVLSSHWENFAAANAGAATWVNGSAGLSGAVSASNSLVGTTAADRVGLKCVALSNGNYVV